MFKRQVLLFPHSRSLPSLSTSTNRSSRSSFPKPSTSNAPFRRSKTSANHYSFINPWHSETIPVAKQSDDSVKSEVNRARSESASEQHRPTKDNPLFLSLPLSLPSYISPISNCIRVQRGCWRSKVAFLDGRQPGLWRVLL